MMGVGKSTIGRFLSKKLNMRFIDIDKVIENSEGTKIKNIFDTRGENFFRKIEEKITLDLLDKRGRVLALGGGAFMNEKIRKKIGKTSVSVWLDLEPKKIFIRINRNKNRPLLKNAKSIKDVLKIYSVRRKTYSLANYKINCSLKSREKIVNEIKKIYENI